MKDELDRYRIAGQRYFQTALEEIKAGHKQSHWMWYIFPQIIGLGMSEISREYAIKDMKEARDYLADDTLKKNLTDMCEALLQNESNDATEIMGYPDDMKLRSSMTLFALADSHMDIFQKVLDKFFDGKKDERTIEILKNQIPDDDWTKTCNLNVDIAGFLDKMKQMQAGETMECPFCGGVVSMIEHRDGFYKYACDSCDMHFETESA